MTDENIEAIEQEIKVGARNSRADKSRIQAAHDTLVELGAECLQKPEVDEMPIMKSDALVSFGGEVKALEDGRVAGYLVRFSTANDPDLTGDFFTKSTDFGEAVTTPIYYHHGLDAKMGKRVIGKGTLRVDDVGVWLEGQLNLRDEYEKAIFEMVKANKQGWSSGTLAHLVEREPVGKAMYIRTWPLGGDASITPTPAEPRNSAIPLKSLITNQEASEAGEDKPATVEVKPNPVESSTESDKSTEVTNTMDENEVKTLTDGLASLKADIAALKAALPVVNDGGHTVTVVKDEADQPWEHAGKFFKAVRTATYYPAQTDPRLRGLIVTADGTKATGMSEGVPADGGYLIPPQFAGGILERMYQGGKILSRLTPDPVTGNSMTYNGVDETSRVAGSRWGGVRGYWLAEAGTLTASKPQFRQFDLKLKKVAALCYATDEQLEDTANLESWLGRVVPEELRFLTEDAIFEGDGVGKPLGILNSPCLVTVLRYATNSLVYEDVLKMWARRYAGVNDYVWFVHQDVTPQIDQFYLQSGIPPRFVDYGADGVLRMKGAPVVEIEYAQSLGTAGDIVLASMSQYQAISKGGIKSASSIHVQFTTDETAFRFIYRIDGEPIWHDDLTPFHGSNSVSPFVNLKAATA